MSNPSVFSEKERADLVAYLDGELEGEAARSLEQKLALDPMARAEADTLKRTWDLLDFLPKKEPSPNFTHQTLSRLGPVPTASRQSTIGKRRRPMAPSAGRGRLVRGRCAGGSGRVRRV